MKARAEAIRAEVHERRLSGEIASMVEEEREANARIRLLHIEVRDPDIPILDRYLAERERIAELVDEGRVNLSSVGWLLKAAREDADVASFHRTLGREAARILAGAAQPRPAG